MDIGSRLISFEEKDDDERFLIDEKDVAYLELTESELQDLRFQFSGYHFFDPDTAMRSIISYCYQNWIFAARLFLNVDLMPFQGVVAHQLFDKTFYIIVATRGFGKSFMLAVYALLRAIFKQGSKIVIVSASFRQSQIVFNYIQDIFKSSVVLQQICGSSRPKKDISMCSFQIGDSSIVSVPLGTGEKIRGLRANVILTDEFSAIPEEIFQVIVRGFSVVSLDPVGKVKAKYREKELIEAGIDAGLLHEEEDGNQIILTGTAYYQFNHFYEWYTKYKNIIECGNDRSKLRDIVGGEISEEELDQLNPEKFGVMRIPYYCLPYGYMDEGIIAQSKATMTKAHFEMEFGAEFYADSDGFFPMSLIQAVSIFENYTIKLRGDKDKKYIMGVDPARQSDHFSIVIVELDESETDRRHKVVYAWATNEKKMKKTGEVNENQTYYGACAIKIRQILSRFNVQRIMMDAGGGGREIANYLQEKQFLKAGEKAIWDLNEPSQRMYEGIHILELISSNSAWVSDANHSMKKSIEEFRLLLPIYDTIGIEKELNSMSMSSNSLDKAINKVRNSMADTLEDVNEEIAEMKKELTNIVITGTPSGNEHFDLPKLIGTTKNTRDVRRKDRYSALVLAHWGIQFLISEDVSSIYDVAGGSAENLAKGGGSGAMYRGLPTGTNYTTTGNVGIVRKSGGGSIVY